MWERNISHNAFRFLFYQKHISHLRYPFKHLLLATINYIWIFDTKIYKMLSQIAVCHLRWMNSTINYLLPLLALYTANLNTHRVLNEEKNYLFIFFFISIFYSWQFVSIHYHLSVFEYEMLGRINFQKSKYTWEAI